MQQNGEAEAIELHPWHDDCQQIVRETKVERRRRVRPAWLQIPVAELDRKSLAGPPPNESRLFERILIEIKMGMVALDVGKSARLRGQPTLCSRPQAWRAHGWLLQGFIAPLTDTGVRRNIRLDRPIQRGKGSSRAGSVRNGFKLFALSGFIAERKADGRSAGAEKKTAACGREPVSPLLINLGIFDDPLVGSDAEMVRVLCVVVAHFCFSFGAASMPQ